jgi:hypothetical protein
MSEPQRYTNMSRAELIEELSAADERILELESFLEGAIELLPEEDESEFESDGEEDGDDIPN